METTGPAAADVAAAADHRVVPSQATVASLERRVAELELRVARLQAERAALWWAAGHDELTGLANRRQFYAVAPAILAIHELTAAVLVLDLNGFKPINDAFGHQTGDEVLRLVARRLAAHAAGDLVARLGGDEFAAVLTHPREPSSAQWWRRTAARLSAMLAEPMWIDGRILTVTASIGVTPGCRHTPIEELLRRADVAMYRAKAVRAQCPTRAVQARPPDGRWHARAHVRP